MSVFLSPRELTKEDVMLLYRYNNQLVFPVLDRVGRLVEKELSGRVYMFTPASMIRERTGAKTVYAMLRLYVGEPFIRLEELRRFLEERGKIYVDWYMEKRYRILIRHAFIDEQMKRLNINIELYIYNPHQQNPQNLAQEIKEVLASHTWHLLQALAKK
ncbi:MAG: hypothetical protein C0179_01335 [Fervidicoccus sp.]|nr:MAG: hypothetical protein C0179_01335 [Fervidicoccus sp.]